MQGKAVLGWREWIALPDLGLPHIKAKIDTGARTSCLHAFKVKGFRRRGTRWVRFHVHPQQGDRHTEVQCEALVKDRRWVTDSGGHRTLRYVIETGIVVGSQRYTIELTLTNRDNMKFRMLLGRTAMHDHFIVDPQQSYCQERLELTSLEWETEEEQAELE
ncbi:MAG TPA: ATP-dependent zinc protease [Thioalkalivibrio sp.]|nr:ATP-dependent zinc protease [Thioalkalivibrio sp.]